MKKCKTAHIASPCAGAAFGFIGAGPACAPVFHTRAPRSISVNSRAASPGRRRCASAWARNVRKGAFRALDIPENALRQAADGHFDGVFSPHPWDGSADPSHASPVPWGVSTNRWPQAVAGAPPAPGTDHGLAGGPHGVWKRRICPPQRPPPGTGGAGVRLFYAPPGRRNGRLCLPLASPKINAARQSQGKTSFSLALHSPFTIFVTRR